MKALFLWMGLLSSGLAQVGFWDSPVRGVGTTQVEVVGKLNQTQHEVFAVLPALYGDLAVRLRGLAARGVVLRLVIAVNGLEVSNGIGVLRGVRGVELRKGLPGQAQGLFLLDRQVLLTGEAVWDSRKQGWRWINLPSGEGAKLSEDLRYLWQAAKPL